MEGYDDDQLGAGEKEGGGVTAEWVCPYPKQLEYDKMLLQAAIEGFEKNFDEKSK